MSTHIDTKKNQETYVTTYITATRFYGGDTRGVCCDIGIQSGFDIASIQLNKQETIDFCTKIIESLEKMD